MSIIFQSENIEKLYQFYNKSIKAEHYEEPWGIHGVEHTRRVLILALSLIELLNNAIVNPQIIIYTALYHDIGRDGDGISYIHGYKSWRKVNRLKLFENLDMTDSDKEIIGFIICNHCIDDEIAIKISENKFGQQLTCVMKLLYLFKDADALDRIRIHDLNIDYLHYKESETLVKLAHLLINTNLLENNDEYME